MSTHPRTAKSFTLDSEVNEYVQRTRGDNSASERVNQLLKRAIQQEQQGKLEADAQAFFLAVGDSERRQSTAFQAASLRSITRD
jgi:hypothetical protein